jgi:phosphoglycerate dehydrogenase-like enzyme
MLNCFSMRSRLLVSAGRELFASFFSPAQEARLSRLCSWERDDARGADVMFNRRLATVDALLTTWDSPNFEEDLLRTAPRLRIIAHCGGEVKSRFAARLFDKLTITNAADPMARATAELGAAFLLYCARDVDHYRAELRRPSNRVYSDVHKNGTEDHIAGREIAMIGFGRVGRALVDLLRGFDLTWSAYDPFASRSLSKNYPVVFRGLKPLLRRANFLVLTAALTERTRGLLDRKALSLLPDGAVVINIARGGIIDLAALTREVRKKRLRCALDVTDPVEPLPVNHPLRNLPGAVVTPHVAGGSRQVRQQMAETVMDDLEKFFRGKPVANLVTRAMLERMT